VHCHTCVDPIDKIRALSRSRILMRMKEICESVEDKRLWARYHSAIGDLLKITGDDDRKALEHFKESVNRAVCLDLDLCDNVRGGLIVSGRSCLPKEYDWFNEKFKSALDLGGIEACIGHVVDGGIEGAVALVRNLQRDDYSELVDRSNWVEHASSKRERIALIRKFSQAIEDFIPQLNIMLSKSMQRETRYTEMELRMNKNLLSAECLLHWLNDVDIRRSAEDLKSQAVKWHSQRVAYQMEDFLRSLGSEPHL